MEPGTIKLLLLLVFIHIWLRSVLGEEIRRQHPRTFQREIIGARPYNLGSAGETFWPRLYTLEPSGEIFRPRLYTLEPSEEIFRLPLYTLESSEISRPHLYTLESSEEIIRPSLHTTLEITEEIIRPRLHTLEITEEIIRPLLHTLESAEEIIRPRLHNLEITEVSTSSTSDSELDIEQQPISNTVQDVSEKQWEHLKNIVQFLAMAVAFFSIIIWVDGWLRVVEAVIYLFYVSTILRELFRFGYHTPTNARNNDAATSSPYVSLSQLIARLAIISVVIAGLNTILYNKER